MSAGLAMPFAGLWDVLTSAGSAFALTFVVALALGIGAVTLFFFGSSVVVLQGFARRARVGWPLLVLLLLVAAVVGLIVADAEELREVLPPDAGPLQVWAGGFALAVGLQVVLVSAAALLLRWLSAGMLARASLVVLGAGYALVVGGSGRVAYALAPALACAVGATLARAARRRAGATAGDVERALWILAAVLSVGIGLAWVGGSETGLAAAGSALLFAFFLLVMFGLLPLAAAGFLGMRHSAEWFIASRYLVAKRRQTFISIISIICAGGVAAGVWLIITVLSVMNGFQQVWREEFVGKRAHLTVLSHTGRIEGYQQALQKVLAVPEVVGASAYLDAEGMVRGDRGQIQGVRIRGIDPSRIGGVSTLNDDLIAGSLGDLEVDAPPIDDPDGAPLPGIAVGSQLAFGLGVGVGDPILVVSPFGGPPTPFGPAPRLHRYRVAAVFQSSFAQYDELVTYVSLRSAQEFLRVSDVAQGIEVRVRDFYRSSRVGLDVRSALGDGWYIRDWKEVFPAFFQALKTERIMMFVLLAMIMVVAAFVIVATLIMMIMEKTSDIAILKAMGAEDDTIERIFAIEGTLIGLAGTAVGLVAGMLVTARLAWVQHQVEVITGVDVLPPSVYQGVSTLPTDLDPSQVAAVAAIAMVLALGATLLPSRQGARLDPAEALRYE